MEISRIVLKSPRFDWNVTLSSGGLRKFFVVLLTPVNNDAFPAEFTPTDAFGAIVIFRSTKYGI